MSEEIINRRAGGRRKRRPFQSARLSHVGAASTQSPGEGIRLNQSDLSKVLVQLVQLPAAAADDQGERALNATREGAELTNVPINTLTATAAGREFKSQNLDLRALRDQRRPPAIVMLGAGIEMKRRRHSRGNHLRPSQENALHGVEIVRAWHVGQDTIIGRRDKGDTEIRQSRQDRGPILQLPPALDPTVLVDAAQDDCRTVRNKEACGELVS
jgi:hypothetical protein